jgi:DNA-binding MarR family transcriptional regulator
MLRIVADQPGISPNAIATQLRLARPTVSYSMQTLRHAGLITVRHSEADSRRVHVSLTKRAEHLLGRYDAVSEEILTAALDKLTPTERAAVAAALPALSKLQITLTS